MYVRPAARGTGAATAILDALHAEARAAGATQAILETGTAQHEAVRFYEREGYERVPCWGAYATSAFSLCYGRAL